MDLERKDTGRERHFVLHVMSFVYGLALKPLQHCLKQMLDKYPREYESYCTKNITQAILIYISDYMDSDETLVDLASQAYQDQIGELSELYEPYKFLKFLAHYTLKSRSEYYEAKLLDSPAKFYSSIVRFLEEMKANNRCGVDFWERLDKAAAAVVAKGLEFHEYDADFSDDENGTSEREFVLMLMKIVSDLYSNPLPDYLRRELDEFMLMSQKDFPPNFETALTIAVENLERNVYFFQGDDEPMYDFFYRLATKSFNARHFLEFCLCCTRRALLEYYVESKKQSPLAAFDRLCHILQQAKQEGKFRSVNAMIEGANEIIADEKMKTELTSVISDASTEFFSDISTESTGPASDRENMFESFEQSLPTIDSVNAVTIKKAQPVIDSAIASTSHAQSTIDNVTAPAREAQPCIKREIASALDAQPDTKNVPAEIFHSAIESVIATGENSRPAIKNVIATGENAQPAIKNVIATGENAQPAIKNVIATGENAQSETKNVIATGENAQSETKNVIATGENVQPVIENVIPFGDNAESSEPENLLVSSEQASNARSCRCCTTL